MAARAPSEGNNMMDLLGQWRANVEMEGGKVERWKVRGTGRRSAKGGRGTRCHQLDAGAAAPPASHCRRGARRSSRRSGDIDGPRLDEGPRGLHESGR